MNKNFEGIYSAIFSVYDENLDVIKQSVAKLVDYQLSCNLKGFYVCGNTGECSVLPVKTRIQMLDAVIDANAGKGQIMAHIGAGHLDDVKALVNDCNNKKIDAVSSLPPNLSKYYNSNEVIDYYKWLAKESKYPLYAYITPAVDDGNVFAFAEKLSKIDNVEGIKLTIPNYYIFEKMVRGLGDKLCILNGPDECLMCGLTCGADGAIGTTYNFLGKTAVALYENFKNNNIDEVRKCQNQINKVIDVAINNGFNMADWKAIMTCMGFDMGYTVFPRTNPDSERIEKIRNDLKKTDFFDII